MNSKVEGEGFGTDLNIDQSRMAQRPLSLKLLDDALLMLLTCNNES